MKILVDADACPSINLITDLAIKNKMELVLYTDSTHNIVSDYALVVTLSQGFQSVDMVITNEIKENDILITQDYGLALICLSKKAKVIHPLGNVYNDENIDRMIFERFLRTKSRKQNIHMKGPKKRTKEDDINLINNLQKEIDKLKGL